MIWPVQGKHMKLNSGPGTAPRQLKREASRTEFARPCGIGRPPAAERPAVPGWLPAQLVRSLPAVAVVLALLMIAAGVVLLGAYALGAERLGSLPGTSLILGMGMLGVGCPSLYLLGSRLRDGLVRDGLTGLRNQRVFHEDLKHAIENARLTDSIFTLVVLDIDGLAAINEAGGHDEGDRALRTAANELRTAVQFAENVYRIGDDEFAAILQGATGWGGFRLARRVREAVLDQSGTAPKLSGGVAEFSGSSDANTMLRHAHLALGEAKSGDRQVLVYSESFLLARDKNRQLSLRHQATFAQALAQAVDVKDSYTRSHCETVSETCVAIGAELGLEPDHLSRLRLAGLLHDVGKVGIPDEILQKSCGLNAEETEIMKTHSTLGHSIVGAADLPDEAYWILHHHERVDGLGYPGGLKGQDIPLESRIILVADALEAMTSDRPYRQARPESEALIELRRLSGTQFDSRCVEALERVLGRASVDVNQALADLATGA